MELSEETFTLELANVLLVEEVPTTALVVTTLHQGSWYLQAQTTTSHDVLLALLQTSLPPDRILQCSKNHLTDGSDDDDWTAPYLSKKETLSQKWTRHTHRALQSLSEWSESVCNNLCHSSPGREAAPSSYNNISPKNSFAPVNVIDSSEENTLPAAPQLLSEAEKISSMKNVLAGMSMEGSEAED